MSARPDSDAFGPPRLHAAGEAGILVEFGSRYAPEVNAAVLAFDAALAAEAPAGLRETVPSFRSLLVLFDPLALRFEALEEQLQALLQSRDWYHAPAPGGGNHWELPVAFGGADGPDLGEVAELTGMRADQLIEDLASQRLTVAMLGFAPGLAYLGQLPERWDFPRRSAINPQVPAGAVLVAVRQVVLPSTGIPTGWRQIGRTPFRSFDPFSRRPFLLAPGDSLRFVPGDAESLARFDMAALRRAAEAEG